MAPEQFPECLEVRHVAVAMPATCWTAGPRIACPMLCMMCPSMFSLVTHGASKNSTQPPTVACKMEAQLEHEQACSVLYYTWSIKMSNF